MKARMSYMEKLLDGVEVEWKPLGEVAQKISSGGTPQTGVLEYYDGNIPWLRTQEVNFNEVNKTSVMITEDGMKNSSAKWIPKNCVIVAMYGATVGKVCINKIPMTTNQACANIIIREEILDHKYVFYFLHSRYNFIKSLGSGSQTNINLRIVRNIEIPIPPLHIQAKIVQILDTFTALTAELTAELTARRKQYNYYREILLQFGPDVEWKTLGEIGELVRGNGLQKKDFTESGVPAIHYGQIFTRYGLFASKTISYTSEQVSQKLKKANKNDLLIATTSENDEDVLKPLAWLGSEAAISGDMMILRHQQNVKYLAYYFQTDFFRKAKMKYITGTKVRRVSKDNILSFQIPLPPLSEQERIVSILDKFDALTHSITEGLPREIELRRKQYKYYRDMLLSFPKPE